MPRTFEFLALGRPLPAESPPPPALSFAWVSLAFPGLHTFIRYAQTIGHGERPTVLSSPTRSFRVRSGLVRR